MNKHLIRIITFLLIPCMVGDSAASAGLTAAFSRDRRSPACQEALVTLQAINGRPLMMDRPDTLEPACEIRREIKAKIRDAPSQLQGMMSDATYAQLFKFVLDLMDRLQPIDFKTLEAEIHRLSHESLVQLQEKVLIPAFRE